MNDPHQICSFCGKFGRLSKKERKKAIRGEPALCFKCKDFQLRLPGEQPLQCSDCKENRLDYSLKEARRARNGDCDVICNLCESAKPEANIAKEFNRSGHDDACKQQPGRLPDNRTLQCSECKECKDSEFHFSKKESRRARKGDTDILCYRCQTAKREAQREAQKKAEEEYEAKRDAMCAEEQAEYVRRLENPRPPWHPFEGNTDIQPEGTITVTSGGVCFGYSNDIEKALSEPLCSIKDALVAGNSYTAPVINNIRAENGEWNAYRINVGHRIKSYTCAWLFCRANRDPVCEFRYILYHSIESDRGGSKCVDQKTRRKLQNAAPFGIVQKGRYELGQWQMDGEWTDDRIEKMLDEGFQFAEYGKKNGSNTIFTKWAGDGKDYSRIVFKENEAYVFLVYGECTMFHGAFFPSMYPKGSIPKPPLMYPLGAPAEEQHEMAMVKWPVFDKEQPQQNEELQQERGDLPNMCPLPMPHCVVLSLQAANRC